MECFFNYWGRTCVFLGGQVRPICFVLFGSFFHFFSTSSSLANHEMLLTHLIIDSLNAFFYCLYLIDRLPFDSMLSVAGVSAFFSSEVQVGWWVVSGVVGRRCGLVRARV